MSEHSFSIFTLAEKIARFESGEIDREEAVELFQELIDSGVIWSLQGHYQRMAVQMLNNGECTW